MQSEFLRIFSERLKRARKLSGMNQEELAGKLNVSKGTVGNWESGSNAATVERLPDLALALNTTADFLLGIAENSEPDCVPAEFPRLVLHYRGGSRIIPMVDCPTEQGQQVMLAYAELSCPAPRSILSAPQRVPHVPSVETAERIAENIRSAPPQPPEP